MPPHQILWLKILMDIGAVLALAAVTACPSRVLEQYGLGYSAAGRGGVGVGVGNGEGGGGMEGEETGLESADASCWRGRNGGGMWTEPFQHTRTLVSLKMAFRIGLQVRGHVQRAGTRMQRP